ncbi:hypothetical protein MIND_00026200 [Mycena indigotica]|uniref:Transmembrane protein n=1 Tax=Mycena indigotica TaxID=2126181 RepID=A0A8H6WDX0_9AGAR|nr:uncharacterized protein MIND_00026200 [Mycena indigotica]KAF7315119.1 hypothetical protein MIND_00026200 [Mycena indigotica]
MSQPHPAAPKGSKVGLQQQLAAQGLQNQEDDKARRKASKDLTQSWMDRLQLISVITTFFASTEAGLLQVTTQAAGDDNSTASAQVANATMLAALVLHIWAAILSFLGAFFIVRYRLREAKEEQKEAVYTQDPSPPDANGGVPAHTDSDFSFLRSPLQSVWTTNPHVEEVGPFQRKPPTHLLGKVHNLCILLTFVGFALAILGILAIAWGQNPIAVGVVTSASTAACFLGAVWVFL